MATIDIESKSRIRVPLEIDNMARKYKTSNGLYAFTSPSLWTLDKHLFYLLRNSVEKEFLPKYKFKPDYLSYDEYGTVALEYILMYVNDVACAEEFDLQSVVIPTLAAIIDIAQDKFPKLTSDELPEVDW